MYAPLNALFRLAFTLASFPQELNLATHSTLVGSFFNRHAVTALNAAPTPCKRTVSDTISSPFRAAFQLSITVLVHYRSGGVFSLATSSWLLPTRFLEPHSTLDDKPCDGKNISSTGLSPSLDPLSSRFDYIIPFTRTPLRTLRLSPQHRLARQLKLFTPTRGQTCVQLGVGANAKGLD